MRRQIAAGDFKGAGVVAHGLRGAAATLAAVDICALATRLEAGCRGPAAGPELARLVDELAGALSGLDVALDGLPRSSPVPTAVEDAGDGVDVGVGNADAVVALLLPLLRQSDTRAGDLANAHAEALRRRLGTRFERFRLQLDQFEFDAAAATLHAATPAAAPVTPP